MSDTASMIEKLRIKAQAEKEKRRREGSWQGSVRAHTEYQDRPVDWIVEHLGIPRHTIEWEKNPEYMECYCPRCEELGNAGRPHLWDGTREPLVKGLEVLSRGESFAVSAGTGTSKTFLLAACGTLMFLATHEESIVFSIAPKRDLLLKNMWKEIGKLFPRFKEHFPQANLLTGNLRMKDGEGEQEVWAATAFGAGVGADEELAQRLKGFHAAKMLWILEETPGIPQAMIETIVKTATGNFNPIMALGNPEHQHDPLRLFAQRDWVTDIRISALDYPNVVTGRPMIPGARTRESIARDLSDADGDETHPHYLAQVRGIAPKQSKRALIRWEWLERAADYLELDEFKEKRKEMMRGPRALGVDPADSPTGDKSAISRWKGAVCTEVESFRADDASEVGRIVYREMMSELAPIDPRYVGLDSVGIGASTYNELKRLGVKVRKISGGTRAIPQVDMEERWSETMEDIEGKMVPTGEVVVEAETYDNTRSQVLWRLREDLRLGRIALPRDEQLFSDLTAIEYEVMAGKIKIERKVDIKARIGRSPDKGDAVAYGNFVRARTPVRSKEKEEIPGVRSDPDRDYGLERLMQRENKRRLQRAKAVKRALSGRSGFLGGRIV